jgi:hypothetical protein
MVNLKLKAGTFRRFAATIDTGAEACLFPLDLLAELEHRITQDTVTVQQAGVAGHEFTVKVAHIKMFLEDYSGGRTQEFETMVWFADTDEKLIGFEGVLDRATLFVDMRETRTGWIELES